MALRCAGGQLEQSSSTIPRRAWRYLASIEAGTSVLSARSLSRLQLSSEVLPLANALPRANNRRNIRLRELLVARSLNLACPRTVADLISLSQMIVMRWSPADVLHPIACLELVRFGVPVWVARAELTCPLHSNPSATLAMHEPTSTSQSNPASTAFTAPSPSISSISRHSTSSLTRLTRRWRMAIGIGSRQGSSRLRVPWSPLTSPASTREERRAGGSREDDRG